jgi:hypothetical protein
MIYLIIIKCVTMHCEYVMDQRFDTMEACSKAAITRELEPGEGVVCTDKDIST